MRSSSFEPSPREPYLSLTSISRAIDSDDLYLCIQPTTLRDGLRSYTTCCSLNTVSRMKGRSEAYVTRSTLRERMSSSSNLRPTRSRRDAPSGNSTSRSTSLLLVALPCTIEPNSAARSIPCSFSTGNISATSRRLAGIFNQALARDNLPRTPFLKLHPLFKDEAALNEFLELFIGEARIFDDRFQRVWVNPGRRPCIRS